jgi:hypothetical protein
MSPLRFFRRLIPAPDFAGAAKRYNDINGVTSRIHGSRLAKSQSNSLALLHSISKNVNIYT